MRENPSGRYEVEVIDFGKFLTVLRPDMTRIAAFSVAVGIGTFLLLLLMPNLYKSSAVIAPSEAEKKTIPAIGALASSFGIQLGGPSTVEDLESLFKSKDLTVRVFRKHNLWPSMFPDDYDPKIGKMKVGWIERLLERKGENADPTDWNAIRAAEECLDVSMNKKSGILTISFESFSREDSSRITGYYLDEAKSRLQEEALSRAMLNKKFIEGQIAKTVDPLTRTRLYELYGQEVEREMMARNREQFGFRVIDAPRAPDRKSKPRRGLAAVTATLIAGLALSAFLLLRNRPRLPPTEMGSPKT